MPVRPLRSLAILATVALACSAEEVGDGHPTDGETQAAGASTADGEATSTGAESEATSDATDDGDGTSDDDGSSTDESSSDATTDPSSTGDVVVECGDGVRADPEECDDGNTEANDGCSSTCEAQRVLQISTGGWHTCAILDTGALRCWGDAPAHAHPEIYDDIGDNETPASVGDVELGGTPTQIVDGWRHGCALLDTGAVRCWGESPNGELGYGNVATVLSPADGGDVETGGIVTQLAAGLHHTCARFDDATVRCWGSGTYGQLGHSATSTIGDDETPASLPIVDVGDDVVQLAAGAAHTCALVDGGDVRCWGLGSDGALGYGNTESIGDDEPPSQAGKVLVGGVVIQIAASYTTTCALLEGGTVRCWGHMEGGTIGYPGLNVIGDDELPAEVGDVDIGGSVAQVSVGTYQICARLESNSVRCWGYGLWGNLGYGSGEPIGDDETPASAGDVPLGGDVALLDANGFGHACAVLENGGLRCWGFGGVGQLGYPALFPQNVGDAETPDSVGNVEVF